jgi:hypothetical protein
MAFVRYDSDELRLGPSLGCIPHLRAHPVVCHARSQDLRGHKGENQVHGIKHEVLYAACMVEGVEHVNYQVYEKDDKRSLRVSFKASRRQMFANESLR